MIKLKRKQVMIEHWHEELMEIIAKEKGCSATEALRFMVCHAALDLREISKIRHDMYSDYSFHSRKAFEKRYK